MENLISECSEIKETETVGKEFFNWAEKNWRLDELIKIDDPTYTSKDYEYIKNIFIKKIDNIISERLG